MENKNPNQKNPTHDDIGHTIRRKLAARTPFKVRCDFKARRTGPTSFGPGPEESEAICVRVRKMGPNIQLQILFKDPLPEDFNYALGKHPNSKPVPETLRETKLFMAKAYVSTMMWYNDVNGNQDPQQALSAKPEDHLLIFLNKLKKWVPISDIYDGHDEFGEFTQRSRLFAQRKDHDWFPETIPMTNQPVEIYLRQFVMIKFRTSLYSRGWMWDRRDEFKVRKDQTTELEFSLMEGHCFNEPIENQLTSPCCKHCGTKTKKKTKFPLSVQITEVDYPPIPTQLLEEKKEKVKKTRKRKPMEQPEQKEEEKEELIYLEDLKIKKRPSPITLAQMEATLNDSPLVPLPWQHSPEPELSPLSKLFGVWDPATPRRANFVTETTSADEDPFFISFLN